MLELKEIKKDYLAGENTVHALKGVSLQFRSSEFVSILGPSGCGKTTMLNIIGGLDKYSAGDLVINGISTKKYKDRNWDAYRNHSVGFVFQSYNLIPHQSVLQNVEIALTLSGVSKRERRARAKAALEAVGLGNQLKKRPSEMSGGQMQRVAIARALVNNPDIILADEPTGALDTETSVQVMDILKEVAKDRLVVMVTHNPELAETYSTRIIRMLDGEILSDSMPLTEGELMKEQMLDQDKAAAKKKKKMPSMSFFTSFSLSLKNLFTKRGRTTLTAFAGSIGIIGIALILSISQGLTTYIDDVQEETLASYPIELEASTIDLTTVIETFMNVTSEEISHDLDAVYQKASLKNMLNAINNLEETTNDLQAFKVYIEEQMEDEDSELYAAINGIQYTYDLDLVVYTENVDGDIIKSDVTELMIQIMSSYMNVDSSTMSSLLDTSTNSDSTLSSLSSYSPVLQMANSVWEEMLPGKDGSAVSALITEQYDLVYGSWPNDYNEVVLVLDENNEMDDMILYALGLLEEDKIEEIADAAVNGTTIEADSGIWSYEEICDMSFRVILTCNAYSYDSETEKYTDLRDTDAGLKYLYENESFDLKVVGIIRPANSSTSILSSGIAYTSLLTEYVIEESHDAELTLLQVENETTDVLTGLPFASSSEDLTDREKRNNFLDYVKSMNTEDKAATYTEMLCLPSEDFLEESVDQAMSQYTVKQMRATLKEVFISQMSITEEDADTYLDSMDNGDIKDIFRTIIEEQVKAQYTEQVMASIADLTTEQLAYMLDENIDKYTLLECAYYYDNITQFSDSTYEDRLTELGYIDLEDPSGMNLYASSFDNKDIIADAIDTYNKSVDDMHQISYTDYIGLMMSSITTIINAITYVLIAFVAISLVVSSIMIGVITLISVQERTKEIGILRAIGASKKNVSSMFNAETIIIGFFSGVLGVVVTILLCYPINIIIHNVTGIEVLNAYLPTEAAIILVCISVFLTLIAGIIPSRSAAKKDPVVALRTE